MSATTSGFNVESELTTEAKIQRLDKPYRDESILRELYEERGLSLQQCADRLGCAEGTVYNWMEKYGIERRDQAEATRDACRVERAAFSHDGGGHEMWVSSGEKGNTKTVYVSQLAAIADGADPAEVFADSTEVHHRNGHPFDNRPENVEVVTRSQHKRTHTEAAWVHDSGLGCRVLETAEREPEAASGQQTLTDFAGGE